MLTSMFNLPIEEAQAMVIEAEQFTPTLDVLARHPFQRYRPQSLFREADKDPQN